MHSLLGASKSNRIRRPWRIVTCLVRLETGLIPFSLRSDWPISGLETPNQNAYRFGTISPRIRAHHSTNQSSCIPIRRCQREMGSALQGRSQSATVTCGYDGDVCATEYSAEHGVLIYSVEAQSIPHTSRQADPCFDWISRRNFSNPPGP